MGQQKELHLQYNKYLVCFWLAGQKKEIAVHLH